MSDPLASDEQVKQEVAELFTRAAPTYGQIGTRFFSHFGQGLVDRMALPKGMNGIDIGTGRGAILFPLAEKIGTTGRVIGIDISSGMLRETDAELGQRGLTNASVRLMDAEALDFADGAFDLATSGYAINFFPHPDRALAEIYRVLKPNGVLGLVMHGERDTRWDWLAGLVRTGLPTGFKPRRSWGFSGINDTNIEAALAAAGFKNIQLSQETCDFSYRDEEDWWQGQLSNSARFFWEEITPIDRERCKADAFAKLAEIKQQGELTQRFTGLFVLARKPLKEA